MSAAMRLAETQRPVDAPYEFASDAVAIALTGLGMKPAEAQRLARTTMETRRKESQT
jgi:hypothetical protein